MAKSSILGFAQRLYLFCRPFKIVDIQICTIPRVQNQEIFDYNRTTRAQRFRTVCMLRQKVGARSNSPVVASGNGMRDEIYDPSWSGIFWSVEPIFADCIPMTSTSSSSPSLNGMDLLLLVMGRNRFNEELSSSACILKRDMHMSICAGRLVHSKNRTAQSEFVA